MTRIGFHMGSNSGLERVVKKNEPIIRYLHKSGADVFYTNEGVLFDNGFAVAHSVEEGGDGYVSAEHSDVQLDVVRDLTGKLSADVPTINEPEVIANARNKASFYSNFEEVTARTAVFEIGNEQTLQDALDQFPEMNSVIIKPVTGNESKDVKIVGKSDVGRYVKEELTPIGGMWLMQEVLPNHTLNQSGIIPLDEHAASQFSSAASGELRIFATTSTEGVPIGRIWQPGEGLNADVYAGVDPDRIPQAAYDLSNFCVRRLVEISGQPKRLLAAVDVWYTGRDNSFDGWQIIEANVKEPAVPKHPVVGDQVGQIVAKELLKP
jgi:hypothetical protein